jgi:Fe-S cluster assembly protein SufD
MGLETIIDEENYESVLFDISRNINNKQKIITINKNIPEPIFLIHKLKETDTFYTNSLKIKVNQNLFLKTLHYFYLEELCLVHLFASLIPIAS